MADNPQSQGIDVGDAVFSFLANTTNLEQGFDRVATMAETKMAATTASIGQAGDAIDDMSDRMAVGAQGAVKLGEVTTLAGTKVKESMYEARGETELLGEMFGIHLPRHVRSFVAELPGVGTALSAAFTATAVLFLLDALVQGAEKIKEFANAAHEIAEAWDAVDKAQAQMFRSLDDNLLQAGQRTAELTNNPLEALRLKLQMLDNQSLAKLDAELEKFGAEADKAFAKMDRNWFSKLFLGLEGSEEAKDKFNAIGKAVSEALSSRTPEAFNDAMKAVDTGIDEAKAKLKELTEQQKAAMASAAHSYTGPGAAPGPAAPDPQTIQAFDEAIKRLEAFKKAITDAKAAENQQADNTVLEEHLKQIGEAASAASKEASRQTAQAKRELDDQLENIRDFVTEQHTLYENRKIDVATLQAAEVHSVDATAIAQEHYLDTIIRVYQQAAGVVRAQASAQENAQRMLVESYSKSGDAIRTKTAAEALDALQSKNSAAATDLLAKAEAAREQLVTLRKKEDREATDALNAAMDKHREHIHKVTEEYEHLVGIGVEKQFEATKRATEELTRADGELSKAQAKLAEDTVSQHFKDQETAITKLTEMHLITEEQKDNRLKLLEQQQANAAIAILTEQLTKEQATIDAAQSKVDYAKANPFSITPAQLAELETNLDKVKIAYTNTQAQIVQEREKFNKQNEENDRGHYGRALMEAKAFGAEMLAQQLTQNHADLLGAENQRDLAKARGDNTAAIEKQITLLKQHEQQLEKEANGDRSVILEQQRVTAQRLQDAQAILLVLKAEGQETTAVEKEIKDLQALQKSRQLEITQLSHLKTGMQGVALATEQMGDMIKKTAMQMDQAFASAIMGALASGKSIGQAMEQATSTVLKNLAEQALAHAIYCTAMGIAELATGVTDSSAAEWFAAAAEFGLVAGASGAAGIAMSSGSSNGGSATQQGPTVGQASSGGGGTNQTTTVTKLASGGVVTQPTIIAPGIVAGDSQTGGSADEAVIPLSDPAAMSRIAKAVTPEVDPQQSSLASSFFPEALARITEAVSNFAGMRDPQKEFKFADPSIETKSRTVGDALGLLGSPTAAAANRDFKFSAPSASDRPTITSGEPSPTERRGFNQAGPSVTPPHEFASASPIPRTVGQALGFDLSPPRQSPATARPEFSPTVPSQTPPKSFDRSQPSSSDRPDLHSGSDSSGFERSEASLPRDMAALEALAASFGGLLSTPTLRAASGSAGVTAGAGTAVVPASGFDANSMEKFADRIGKHINDSGSRTPSGGGESGTQINVHVKGMLDSGNLKKIIKKTNRLVSNRQATVKASDSQRVTRRSQ